MHAEASDARHDVEAGVYFVLGVGEEGGVAAVGGLAAAEEVVGELEQVEAGAFLNRLLRRNTFLFRLNISPFLRQILTIHCK